MALSCLSRKVEVGRFIPAVTFSVTSKMSRN